VIKHGEQQQALVTCFVMQISRWPTFC